MSWTQNQKLFYETYYLILSDLTRNVYKDKVSTKQELREKAWNDTENPTYMSPAIRKTIEVLGWPEIYTLSQLKEHLGVH